MTHENEVELDPDDELGQIEAYLPPVGVSDKDPFEVDRNYDDSLLALDPDEQGNDLPSPEE